MTNPTGPSSTPSRLAGLPSWVRLAVCGVAGVVVGVAAGVPGTWQDGLLIGWVSAAGVFVAWTWTMIWPMDSAATRAHAEREDAGRAVADVVILAAAVASLGAVALLLSSGSKGGGGGSKDLQAALSVAGVVAAWATVHTLFTIRYARLYYQTPVGGVSFNEDDPPRYSDFAYLAFTIGMTYQVSDTDLQAKDIRAAALRHGLLSFLLGVGVIAVTINLVAGLGQ